MRRLVGIHAVSAALKSVRDRGDRIDRVIVAKGSRNPRLRALLGECGALGIPVRFEPRGALRRIAGTESHQGIVALSSSSSYQPLERVLESDDELSTVVILDSVQDPRNLGAVIRTADGAGVSAVVIPERRSAGLSEAAAKAAAGALESVPVVRVKNLGRALEQLKEAGYWAYGFDGAAATDYHQVEYSDRCALVLGSESRGLRKKVAVRCDFLLRIPLAGSVSSLNVSVAAGIAMYEVRRQHRESRGEHWTETTNDPS